MRDQNDEAGDAELIRLSAAGDRDAFDALVAGHAGAVFRFVSRLAADPASAEDALQETFLAAWRSARSYRGDAAVRTWLLTIARNAVHRQHRRRVGEPQEHETLPELGLAAGWGQPDPEELALRREWREVVQRALDRLGDADREILLLRDVEDLPGEEVATILGLTVAAMKTRLHRARLRLSMKVKETYAHA